MDIEAYGAITTQHANGAAACWAVVIAKDTGLLEVFLTDHQPMTVEEIATKANLKQRYVQELLGCLVTSNLVEIDDESIKYHVPEMHRSSLLEFSQLATMLDFVQDRRADVKECMKPSGPNGYSSQAKPGFMTSADFGRSLNNDDFLEEVLFSSTPDIVAKLESGIDYIEFGCGSAIATIELATRYPKSRFVASDYSPEALAVVDKTIASKNLTNIRTEQADLYNLPSHLTGKYDVAYVHDVIHDLGDPVRGLIGINQSVKAGGFLNIIDVDIKGTNHKENKQDAFAPFAFACSTASCLPESLGQDGGVGMGCCAGLKALESMFEKAGIPKSSIVVGPLKTDSLQIKFVCRKN